MYNFESLDHDTICEIPFNRVLNRSVAWAGSTDTGKPGEPPEPQQRGGERRERYPGEAGGAQGGEEQ